jgi:predicted NUDIX family NTP pyrophosphohydrolase
MYMTKLSAGLLLYRLRDGKIEVLLIHPGGPFWAKKDLGAWSIPKGLTAPGEDPLAAARREFGEETGLTTVSGSFIKLAPVKVHTKIIEAWAIEGDCDPATIKSNTFTTEWPPKSGKQQEFPEADRAAWFGIEEAKIKINGGQAPLLEDLRRLLTKKNSR